MPDASLKELAVRGAIWTLLGFAERRVLRLGFNLIVTGLTLFCDLGIAPAVVRDPRGEEAAFLNTAWTMQILREIGIACCCVLAAWPVSHFYGDRRLLWILPAIGLGSLVSGFNSTSLLTFKRNMQVRQQVVVEAGTQLLSGGVMILWARLSPTVWALVAGTVAPALLARSALGFGKPFGGPN